MTGGRLDGNVAVIAGSGRGIGRCIATWFAQQGADLVLLARTGSEVTGLAAELESTYGIRTLARSADVADLGAMEGVAGHALERFGRIDIAIANAAVLGPVGTIGETDPVRWVDTLATNVGGTFNLVRSVLPAMMAQGHGRIITMSGGGVGGPRLPERISAYIASKAAVVALTEVVAKELPPGVTINAVAPGAVPTTFMQEVVDRGPTVAGVALHSSVATVAAPDLEPLRRLLLYMVSPEAAELSGCCLSARWDDPAMLATLADSLAGSSRFRLRRIDEDLFHEVGHGAGA